MRKLFMLLMVMCVATLPALAEGALPPGAVLIEAPAEGANLYGMLPLKDGAKVFGGQIEYANLLRDPYRMGYPDSEELVRSDAYAVCIEADGSVRWELRLADSQAVNRFFPLGLLPDGRILMSFSAEDTSFGSKLFIVRQDGAVEEMVNYRKLSEAFPPMSMEMVPQGYVGGDSTVVDSYYERHFNPPKAGRYTPVDRHIRLLDFDLELIWELDMSEYSKSPTNFSMMGMDDATLLYDWMNKDSVDDGWRATAMLVNLSGEVLWEHAIEGPRLSSFSTAQVAQDGFLLGGNMWATDGTDNATMLWKLSRDGELLWTKDLADWRIDLVRQIMPMGDGFVVLCMHELNDALVCYLDGDGNVRAQMELTSTSDAENHALGMIQGKDGKLYLYGTLLKWVENQEKPGYQPAGFHYTALTADTFKQ